MKYGYISTNHVPDGMSLHNIIIKVNGEQNHGKYIQRCHDIEGWFEYLIVGKRIVNNIEYDTHQEFFEYANIDIEFIPQEDPKHISNFSTQNG